jgi:hypothetical protein
MDPVTIECAGACTVTLVLDYPWQSLTAEDGALISAAILGVWAVGFGFRALIRMVRESDETERNES